MNELRITDTNSANDSKGRAFGLEGNDFVYVLGAFVASLALYLVFTLALHVALGAALLLSLPGFLATAVWVIGFRHNRPAGYAEDVFDDLVNGEGWSLAASSQRIPSNEDSHAL